MRRPSLPALAAVGIDRRTGDPPFPSRQLPDSGRGDLTEVTDKQLHLPAIGISYFALTISRGYSRLTISTLTRYVS